jgi:uncharacterized membrane protein YcjF (UPF0283 family)
LRRAGPGIHGGMTTPNTGVGAPAQAAVDSRSRGAVRRITTETKQAFKTTEFWSFVVVAAGILISAAAIHGGDNTTDEFTARNAWLYVAIVTAGYLISRGLAKAGSYEEDTGHRR